MTRARILMLWAAGAAVCVAIAADDRTADAQKVNPKFGAGKVVAPNISAAVKASGGQSTPHDVIMGELRAAHKLIQNANHDYDGHRGRAVHEVGLALKALKAGHKGKHGAAHNPHYRMHAIHEGQLASDLQMAQAQAIVHTVMGQLSAIPNNHKVNVAEQHLGNAVVQIDRALAFSAKFLRKQ